MLYIDGNAVVNNNNFQGATQATGIADLTPGQHAIDVEYYQGGGGATMDVQWDPTGGTNFVDIPNSAFSTIQAVNGLTMTGTGTLTLTKHQHLFRVDHDRRRHPDRDGERRHWDRPRPTGIVVDAGGALAFTGGVNYTSAEPITISGSGPAGNGAIENISGTNTFAVPIALSGTATIGSDAGDLTLGGNISDGLGHSHGDRSRRDHDQWQHRLPGWERHPGGQRHHQHRRQYQPGLGGQPHRFQFRARPRLPA